MAEAAGQPAPVADAAAEDPLNFPEPDVEVANSVEAVTDTKSMSPHRLATLFGVAVVAILALLAGWTGYQRYQSHQAAHQRDVFLQVARQGAINLTTIDWQHADSDVQRVLDSATGAFRDDFAARSKPFVEVVKRAKSTSVGTVTQAGIESVNGEQAQVILAMSVKTTMAGEPESAPRSWRMRLTIQGEGHDQAKVSNVVFVP